jgi:putative selenate reductase molybdopterin-binding subunit
LEDSVITALNGDALTVAQVAARTLYDGHETQIMADAAEVSSGMPSSFAAQGAEVEVDTETGALRVLRAITVIDAGRVINPFIAEGHAEGDVVRALGQAVSEEMLYDQHGVPLTVSLSDYHVYSAPDAPQIETHFVETPDPSGPFGSKSFDAATAGGMVAAVANAVADALGIRIRQLPLTPERVLHAIRRQAG